MQAQPHQGRAARFGAYLALGLVALGLVALASPGFGQTAGSVTTYHADAARSAHYVAPGLTWQAAARMRLDAGFDGRVPGHVYAQPLVWNPGNGAAARLIVVTESNDVVALDAGTGRTIWQRHLGTALPSTKFPCTNIDPVGITGTPVIDPRTGVLYLDAMIGGPGGPRQQVFGLSQANGAMLPGWPIDVRKALAARGFEFVERNQQQRAALALIGSRVFVAFGGFAGDCGWYHGIILGLDTAPPRLAAVWMARGLKGGVWAPGGISVVGQHLFFATGNTERAPTASGWDDGVSVFRETPALLRTTDPRDSFTPQNYADLDDLDLDLGGTEPVPLDMPDGAHRLLALGKDGKAYLLDRNDLGGIGGAVAVQRVAGGPIITGPAVYRLGSQTMMAFRAPKAICPEGDNKATALVGMAVSDRGMRAMWCAPVHGGGIPIVTTAGPEADPIIWFMGAEGDNRLHGFRGDTGQPVYTSGAALPGMRHFVTPVVAGGRLYVAGDGRVFAFGWGGQTASRR